MSAVELTEILISARQESNRMRHFFIGVEHLFIALLEIQGTKGTLSMPDPNMFGGPVRIRSLGESEWREMPISHAHTENSRVLGAADMAVAIRTGRKHRANGDMAFHVLDVMHSVLEASNRGKHIKPQSSCERPEPLPTGLGEYQLDE